MGTEIIEQLIQEIRDAEKSGRMTRYQLSKASGIPQSTLSRLMSGERDSIRVETLVAICDALGLSLEMRPAKKGRKS